jgi:hypothetical protein
MNSYMAKIILDKYYRYYRGDIIYMTINRLALKKRNFLNKKRDH